MSKMRAQYVVDDLLRSMQPDKVMQAESKILRAQYKIMVVSDSNAVQNRTLSVVRQSLGFTNTKVCSSVDEALDELRANDYDLILASYRMPDKDSTELHKALQNHSNPPMFMIVADFTQYEQNNLRQAGIVTLPSATDNEALKVTVAATYARHLEELVKKWS